MLVGERDDRGSPDDPRPPWAAGESRQQIGLGDQAIAQRRVGGDHAGPELQDPGQVRDGSRRRCHRNMQCGGDLRGRQFGAVDAQPGAAGPVAPWRFGERHNLAGPVKQFDAMDECCGLVTGDGALARNG
jgi:hypothetical protein